MKPRGGMMTHAAAINVAFELTKGPVLELGGGGSTKYLHDMCAPTGRRLVTMENNPEWFAKIQKGCDADFHEFVFVKNWSNAPMDDEPWSFVLVDHAPGERRIVDIERLAKKAALLVIHDTETVTYMYDRIWHLFEFKKTDKRQRPWTTMVSNFIDIDDVEFPEI
jgi:hypothetical protein